MDFFIFPPLIFLHFFHFLTSQVQRLLTNYISKLPSPPPPIRTESISLPSDSIMGQKSNQLTILALIILSQRVAMGREVSEEGSGGVGR